MYVTPWYVILVLASKMIDPSTFEHMVIVRAGAATDAALRLLIDDRRVAPQQHKLLRGDTYLQLSASSPHCSAYASFVAVATEGRSRLHVVPST